MIVVFKVLLICDFKFHLLTEQMLLRFKVTLNFINFLSRCWICQSMLLSFWACRPSCQTRARPCVGLERPTEDYWVSAADHSSETQTGWIKHTPQICTDTPTGAREEIGWWERRKRERERERERERGRKREKGWWQCVLLSVTPQTPAVASGRGQLHPASFKKPGQQHQLLPPITHHAACVC